MLEIINEPFPLLADPTDFIDSLTTETIHRLLADASVTSSAYPYPLPLDDEDVMLINQRVGVSMRSARTVH